MKYSIIQLLLVCCLFTTSYAATNGKQLTLNQANTETFPVIRVGFDAPKIDHRQLLLAAHEATTDGLDWGYDAEMYEVLLDDMYWLIETKKCVIQGVQSFYIDKEIPLGIVMSEQGEIQIKIDELENPVDSLVIYLKDKELDKLYNIQDSVYQTTLAQGEYSTRFAITFKGKDFVNNPTPPLDEIEDPVNDSIQIAKKLKVKAFYNHKISSIVLKKNRNFKINKIKLFNKHGVLKKTWRKVARDKKVVLPITLKKGLYYVIIKSKTKNFKKKILIR